MKTEKKIPDKQRLIQILRYLIDIHPIKPVHKVRLFFIYIGLLDHYPGIISYSQLHAISKRRKTPEQIAEAIMLIRNQQT